MTRPSDHPSDLFIRQIRPAVCVPSHLERNNVLDFLERAALLLVVSALWGLVFYLALSSL